LENHPRYLELAWAAQRAGLRYTAISPRLTVDEVSYILEDSGTQLLFASGATAEVASQATAQSPGVSRVVLLDGAAPGLDSYDELAAGVSSEPLADEAEGVEFL